MNPSLCWDFFVWIRSMLIIKNNTIHIAGAKPYTAVFFMLLSTFSVAVISLLAKKITHSFDLNSALFLRFFLPLVVLLFYMVITKRQIQWSQKYLEHFIRAIFVTLSQYCLFYYVSVGTLFNATVLFNTAPIFITVLTIKFNGQLPNKFTLIAISMGFIGIACILKPSGGIWQPMLFIGMLSGFFMACSQITTFHLSKTESADIVTFYLYLFGTIITLLILIISFQMNSPAQQIGYLSHISQTCYIWLLFIIATFGVQVFRTKAYALSNNPNTLAPLLFTTVLFSSIFDLVYYHQVITLSTLIGGVLIFLSSIISLFSKVE